MQRCVMPHPVAGSEPRSSLFLIGVVEDDAECVTLPRAQAANSVPQVDPIGTARSLNRTMMHGEGYAVTLA